VDELDEEELELLNEDRRRKNLPELRDKDCEIYDDDVDVTEFNYAVDDGCYNTEYGTRVYGWKLPFSIDKHEDDECGDIVYGSSSGSDSSSGSSVENKDVERSDTTTDMFMKGVLICLNRLFYFSFFKIIV
jgi:hypothetical protein